MLKGHLFLHGRMRYITVNVPDFVINYCTKLQHENQQYKKNVITFSGFFVF